MDVVEAFFADKLAGGDHMMLGLELGLVLGLGLGLGLDVGAH